MEKLRLVGSKTVREVLSNYPEYTLYITKGFAFKGAKEVLEDKQPKQTGCRQGFNFVIKNLTFEERMQKMYDFYVAFDIDIDHENKELHINAFSANDMY